MHPLHHNYMELKTDLASLYPAAKLDAHFPDSGAFMMHVHVGSRVFVIESWPDGVCGYDELGVPEAEGFNCGYHHVTDDFPTAAFSFKQLIKSSLESEQ